MTLEDIQTWIDLNPALAPWVVSAAMIVSGLVVFVIARFLIARGLVYVAKRTENKYDDLIVENLRPFRFAWIAPLLVIYYFAGFLPNAVELVRQIVLFLILWLVVITVNALLNAVNAIYESSTLYHGEPIQGYLDLVKIILIVVALIVTTSMFTGKSPLVLLSGLGALMAVILLIFRDTILSFMASIQIRANDLIMEGDALEVPSYGADGDVLNIALHTVTIQNWDKTITVIPTYRFLDTPYKNWRGMQESGGRRIKRAIHIDLTSIKFCDQELVERLTKIDLLRDFMEAKSAEIESHSSSVNPVNKPQFTNIDAFRAYVVNYLKSRPDLHHERMTLLVRQLAPGPSGIPLEVYVFTKTVEWAEYEAIQADIFSHLVAIIPEFELRVFQEPAGRDFQALADVRREIGNLSSD